MARSAKFGSDARASITVEFALLAPVMLIMVLGSASAARLARASIKAWNVAQSIGDLVAQQTTLTTAGMTDFCTGGRLTLAPFTGALTATVASVTYATSGTRAVDWQDTTCGGATLSNALALGTPYTPTLGDSVIVVQTTYVYAFPPSYVLPSSFIFRRTTYSRPRAGTAVAHA